METASIKKRICSGDRTTDVGGEGRGKDGKDVVEGGWEGMNPEILALIFVRLPVDEMMQAVPLVCKSWFAVVAEPYCWTEIDIEEWCRRCNRPGAIDSTVRELVRRSQFTFQRLSVCKLGDSGFAFAANCARCLKVLQIPMSNVTDEMVEKHAESLAKVTVLDISYCLKITTRGLEVLGKNCKSLIQLKREMPSSPCNNSPCNNSLLENLNSLFKIDNREAMVVADTMPGLIQLDLAFGHFDDRGLDAILTKCEALTHLDILGCWNVQFEGDLKRKCGRLLVYQSPWLDDYAVHGSSSSDNENIGDLEGVALNGYLRYICCEWDI